MESRCNSRIVDKIDRKWISREEACQYLGCSRLWLMKQAVVYNIPVYKVDKKLFFAISDLDKMITMSRI